MKPALLSSPYSRTIAKRKKDDDLPIKKLNNLIEKCNSCTIEKLKEKEITNKADELLGLLKEVQLTEDTFPQISKELKKVTSQSKLFKDIFSEKLLYFYRRTYFQSPPLWNKLIVAIKSDETSSAESKHSPKQMWHKRTEKSTKA